MSNSKSQFFIYTFFKKIVNFLYKFSLNSVFSYILFICSIISCSATYFYFTNYTKNNVSSNQLLYLLYTDIVLLLILIALVSHKIIKLWYERKKSSSILQRRMTLLFSLLSIIPSIFMSIFAAIFFHNGIESWLNDTNKKVLQESLTVAESYIQEHKFEIVRRGLSIAKVMEFTLGNQFYNLYEAKDTENFKISMNSLLDLESIQAAILYDENCNIIFASESNPSLLLEKINKEDFQDVIKHSGKLLKKDQAHLITAITLMKFRDQNFFLLIQRKADKNIVAHIGKTRQAFLDFKMLCDERLFLEVTFVMIFMIMVVLLLFAAMGIAISFSGNIIRPVANLIDVAEQISKGNLKIKVDNDENDYEEMNILIETFNEMINQLYSQQQELENKNLELKEKQQFTQTVLSGTSSGIISIDKFLFINIWNTTAENLLSIKLNTKIKIDQIIPEIKLILENAKNENQIFDTKIQYQINQQQRMFIIKAMYISTVDGYVITIDDVTNLLIAQRKAMWSDIARRVAHEIKNPLTPIQLSAERLRRKYSNQILYEKEKFSELIDVIVRQVGDIKRLTDEFTMFARLPSPILKKINVIKVCEQACILMQQTDDNIKIFIDHAKNINVNNFEIYINVDERLIHQVLINVVKNAIIAHQSSNQHIIDLCKNRNNVDVNDQSMDGNDQSISDYNLDIDEKNFEDINSQNQNLNDEKKNKNIDQNLSNTKQNTKRNANQNSNKNAKQNDYKFVKIYFEIQNNKLNIFIEDNGPGLPNIDNSKLTEPYFSMSNGGSGLGLAIVKKIIEDHHGNITITNNLRGKGAICTITLPGLYT